MSLSERVGNLHIHTQYSDGTADVAGVVASARAARLDFCIVTDHNAYPSEHAGWHDGVLLLVGQEVHDVEHPDENHCLLFGTGEDLSALGGDPQALIEAARERGGLAFLAHPYEHSGAYTREPEIAWRRWDVTGYAGLELWNYMSEFKSHLSEPAVALVYAYWPKLAMCGPYPETLARWDSLLGTGRCAAVGGSDAHGIAYRMGPIRKRVFSYRHCFRALNTHALVRGSWHYDLDKDEALVLEALGHGRAFVGYDALAPTRGFRFAAGDRSGEYGMGDEFVPSGIVRFGAETPARARLRLIANGHSVQEAVGRSLSYESDTPGVYRVEAYRRYLGRWRGWIYSNPIYVRASK